MPTSSETPTAAPEPLHRRLSFLVTPRWIILIIVVIVFSLACYMLLAPWQFRRSAEQNAFNEQLATAVASPPVPVSQLMSSDRQPADDVIWRVVTATGTFEADRQAYIRLRHSNDGDPASEVVVPFVTEDGTVVLVDRGYVLLKAIHAAAPLPPLPDGVVTVTGRVQADQVDPRHRPAVVGSDGLAEYTAASSDIVTSNAASSNAASSNAVSSNAASSNTASSNAASSNTASSNTADPSGGDSGSIDSQSATPNGVYLGYLQLTPDSPGVMDAIALPQQDPGPFFSYAVQWLIFGAIAVAGIGYFAYREFSDPVDGDIYLSDLDIEGDTIGKRAQIADPVADPDGDPRADPRADPGTAPSRSRENANHVIDKAAVGTTAIDGENAPTPRRSKRARFDKSQLFDAE